MLGPNQEVSMTRKSLSVLVVGSLLFFVTAPLFAHHSFDAEYDRTKPIKFEGKISKVDWMNPHIYIYVDAKDANGKTVTWAVEGSPPNDLYRRGIKKESILIGTPVSVKGYMAKKPGALFVNGSLTTEDGRSVFQGATGGGAPG